MPADEAAQPRKADAGREFVEICGVGRVRRSELQGGEDGSLDWQAALSQQMELTRADVLERLDAGTDSQRTAAALLREDIQGAARRAAGTSDAGAYRMALRACRRDAASRAVNARRHAWLSGSAASAVSVPELLVSGAEPDACGMLSLERLEVLDPGDALPTLTRLADGLQRADGPAVDQALFQFGQRQHSWANPRGISVAVSGMLGAEPAPAAALLLLDAITRDMNSWGAISSGSSSLLRACSAEALRDANRRQLCEQAVRRLPETSRELLDARLLHLLEERLGVPHSPQALSKEENERIPASLGATDTRWIEEPSCANLGEYNHLIAGLARDGEVATTRALMKARTVPAPAARR